MTIGKTDLTPTSGVSQQGIVTPVSARALFWRPRFLRSSDSLPHLPFMFWLIDRVRPRTFAEIGLDDGVSYFGACQAMDRLGESLRCYGLCADAVPADLLRYNEEHYDEFSGLRSGSARDLASQLADGSVDLLSLRKAPDAAMIDALIDEWPRKLSARSVILIHCAADWPTEGPARLWLDNMGLTHPVIAFEEGRGLLAVLVGPDQPDQLSDLAALDTATPGAGEVRHVFRRLGAAVEHEWAARDRAARLDIALAQTEAAEAAVEEARTRATAAAAELETLRQSYASQEREVAILSARIEAAETHRESFDFAALLRQQSRVQTELGTLRAKLVEAEDRVSGSRRAEETARAALTAAEEARAEAEARAAERIAAKDRALQQLSAARTDAEARAADHLATTEQALQQLSAARAEAEALAAEVGLQPSYDLRLITQQLELERNGRDEINQSLQALKVAHAELNAEVEHLRLERDALINSTFWKMTSPARRVVDGLRRLRGR